VGAAHALDDGAELPEGREEDLDLGGRELREPQAVDLLCVHHPVTGGGPGGMAGEARGWFPLIGTRDIIAVRHPPPAPGEERGGKGDGQWRDGGRKRR